MNLTGLAFALVTLVAVVLADRLLHRVLDRITARETASEKRTADQVAELERQVQLTAREISSVKSILALKQSK